MAFNPTVDKEKCNGCEECVDACTVDVYEMQNGKAVPVNAEKCIGCETCIEVCKENAIAVVEIQPALSEQALSLLKDINS
jgi:NAD-dependent dihydropyrimidine dehydrogenase PreA subunit